MDTKDKVQMILRQTDYTEDVALEKLKENNDDPIVVIKKYMGVYKEEKPEDKLVTNRNQETFKQFRQKLHITKFPNA